MILARNSDKKKNIKLLLVENEPIFQHLHFLMLEELGCYVDFAETGEQALASAIYPQDIIFMSVELPDLKSTTVTTRIRNSDLATKNTPIIILAVNNVSEIEEEYFSVGANAVVLKPVSSENFKKILKKYIVKAKKFSQK
jgi:CheY-like chemotaxis protein